MTKSSYCKSGFTLVELIVVLVIIALVSAIAVPAYFSSIKNAELQKDAQTLISVLRIARDSAMNEKGRVGVAFDTEKKKMTLYRVVPGEKNKPLEGELGNPHFLSEKSSFASIIVSGNKSEAVEYSPLGTTGPASIIIKGEGGTIRVEVDPVTGDASIAEETE